ncbi:MAG: hypothetical protein IKC59_04395, partial [Clostridia bacterium]|nr:hypothetical protein [Clostridia bacterium]
SKLLRPDFVNTKEADRLQQYLSHAAMVEAHLVYPCIAKYHLNKYEGVSMSTYSRSADEALLTDYQKHCMDQFAELSKYVESQL